MAGSPGREPTGPHQSSDAAVMVLQERTRVHSFTTTTFMDHPENYRLLILSLHQASGWDSGVMKGTLPRCRRSPCHMREEVE